MIKITDNQLKNDLKDFFETVDKKADQITLEKSQKVVVENQKRINDCRAEAEETLKLDSQFDNYMGKCPKNIDKNYFSFPTDDDPKIVYKNQYDTLKNAKDIEKLIDTEENMYKHICLVEKNIIDKSEFDEVFEAEISDKKYEFLYKTVGKDKKLVVDSLMKKYYKNYKNCEKTIFNIIKAMIWILWASAFFYCLFIIKLLIHPTVLIGSIVGVVIFLIFCAIEDSLGRKYEKKSDYIEHICNNYVYKKYTDEYPDYFFDRFPNIERKPIYKLQKNKFDKIYDSGIIIGKDKLNKVKNVLYNNLQRHLTVYKQYADVYIPEKIILTGDNTLSYVIDSMEKGTALNYREAIFQAEQKIYAEKNRAEDVERQERMARANRIHNAEMLASQQKAEKYAREQAEYAKEQAEYARQQAESQANEERYAKQQADNTKKAADELEAIRKGYDY